uniref:Uncharacterized protein n=1 Tax=Streptomyces sp. NBC_00003 TaxID=2903608 RepID=A0AAU2V4Z4_9ACTN
MKIPLTIHQVTLKSRQFKVIRPAAPPSRAVLLDQDRYLGAYLDQDAAYLIAGLWELAASSPRALIHLPMRSNPAPSHDLPGHGTRQLDLVLLHHSLQFAPSRWKDVRARLGTGRRRTVTLPGASRADADRDSPGVEARHYKENRDLFHQHLHAETLFMTGSAKVFRETAPRFRELGRRGPGFAPGHPGHSHCCTELHSTEGILGNAREMHIEYRDQWESRPR